jgi:hypothetical protein
MNASGTFDDLSHKLMAGHQREGGHIFAAEDVQIRATDPSLCHADDDFIGLWHGIRHTP